MTGQAGEMPARIRQLGCCGLGRTALDFKYPTRYCSTD